jgi:hypothetical protein
MSMLFSLLDEPSNQNTIPKLKLPVRAIDKSDSLYETLSAGVRAVHPNPAQQAKTPAIPASTVGLEPIQRIAYILRHVLPIPSTPEHLYELISKSPLLLPEQRVFLQDMLPNYLYSIARERIICIFIVCRSFGSPLSTYGPSAALALWSGYDGG